MSTEPHLQPISSEQLTGASANTQDGARLDVAANGLWGGWYERTYFDIRVFNSHGASNKHTNPSACYRKHENLKKRAYEQRILEKEHCSFSPIVIGHIATSTYKRLSTVLAEKWGQPYSSTMTGSDAVCPSPSCSHLFRPYVEPDHLLEGPRDLPMHRQIDLAISESLVSLT